MADNSSKSKPQPVAADHRKGANGVAGVSNGLNSNGSASIEPPAKGEVWATSPKGTTRQTSTIIAPTAFRSDSGVESYASKLAKLRMDGNGAMNAWAAGVGARGGGTTSAPPADSAVKNVGLNKQPMHAPFKTSMQYGAGSSASNTAPMPMAAAETSPSSDLPDAKVTAAEAGEAFSVAGASASRAAASMEASTSKANQPTKMSWAMMAGAKNPSTSEEQASQPPQQQQPPQPQQREQDLPPPPTSSQQQQQQQQQAKTQEPKRKPKQKPKQKQQEPAKVVEEEEEDIQFTFMAIPDDDEQPPVKETEKGAVKTSSGTAQNGAPSPAPENNNSSKAANKKSKAPKAGVESGGKGKGKGAHRPACHYWIKGTCTKGDKCDFLHVDVPNAKGSAANFKKQQQQDPGNQNGNTKAGKNSKSKNNQQQTQKGKLKNGAMNDARQQAVPVGVMGPGNGIGMVQKGAHMGMGTGKGAMMGGRGGHMQPHFQHGQPQFHHPTQQMYAVQQPHYGNHGGAYMPYAPAYGGQWQQQMYGGGRGGGRGSGGYMRNGGGAYMMMGGYAGASGMQQHQQHHNMALQHQHQQRIAHLQQMSMQQQGGAAAAMAARNSNGNGPVANGAGSGAVDEPGNPSSSSSSSSSSSPNTLTTVSSNDAVAVDASREPTADPASSATPHNGQPSPPPQPPLPPPPPPPPPHASDSSGTGNSTAGAGAATMTGVPAMPMSPAAIAEALGESPQQHLMVPNLDNSLLFSVDVECVATGVQHHDRAVAQIGMVNCFGQQVLNLIVKPDKPVLSYLTPLTGLTKEQVEQYGMPEADALKGLKQALPKNAILVGMNIRKDIEWLKLEEGKDFHSCYDLAGLFRVWNKDVRKGPRSGSWTYFGLDHCAATWLNVQRGVDPATGQAGGHDAVRDAYDSMWLFNVYRQVQHDPAQLQLNQYRTLTTPPKPSFAKQNPTFENCCMGNRKTCVCGAPFFS